MRIGFCLVLAIRCYDQFMSSGFCDGAAQAVGEEPAEDVFVALVCSEPNLVFFIRVYCSGAASEYLCSESVIWLMWLFVE